MMGGAQPDVYLVMFRSSGCDIQCQRAEQGQERAATFPSAGRYLFRVTIADAGGLTATSSLVVTVTRP